MEKKKIFVIFTYEIFTIGGGQAYTAGKAKYLEKNEWNVYMFFLKLPNQNSTVIPSLNKFADGGFTFFSKPPYKFPRSVQAQYLKALIDSIRVKFNVSDFNNCEILVESHYSIIGYWAELFAAAVGARHIFLCLDEDYTSDWKTYRDNLDFFYFKLKRNELVISKSVCNVLFNGYKNVRQPLIKFPNVTQEQEPIQDIDFPLINRISKRNYNICHIGRIVKNYVPYVIEGVAEFARRYPDKAITFILVGNVAQRQDFIVKTFEQIGNVEVIALGDLVPIPRILFSKVDVVCAISQTARFVANEGVLTIVGKADQPDRTPGVLGYDTKEQIYGEGTYSYCEALENVLVKRLYNGKEYQLPKLKPAEEYYKNFWTILENAAPNKEYYVERLTQERIRNWSAIFPFGTVARGARIILFGATEIAKDYRQQIQSQANTQKEIGADYIKQIIANKPYCTIMATVDEHPENFDDSVVGIERLKQKDYDAILITTYPQQAQAAYNKIVQVVPEMANRVVYNFNTLQI